MTRGEPGLRVHVHLVPDRHHARIDGARADLQRIGAVGQQRVVAQPHHVAGELVGHRRGAQRVGDHVAAAGVQLAVEAQRHRLAFGGARQVAAGDDDALDARALHARLHHHFVAARHAAAADRAGVAAEALVGPVHPLHRHAEVLGARRRGVGGLQQLQQGRPLVPRQARGARAHVVAARRDHRQAVDPGDAQRPRQRAIGLDDAAIDRLVATDQIHLVHRQHHLADAEQAADVGMPAGLRQQALARVHQHHGQLGVGGAGGHVARVLLVAGAVGHDEAAPRGVEITPGHVDRDALLALGVEAVGEQGEIQRALRLGVQPAAVALERGELVVRQHAGVVQQAPEQGALAVVHAAAGDEAQQALLGVGGGHQK